MVQFTADRIKVLEALKHIKVAVGKNLKKANPVLCELTITSAKATFAVPGAMFSVQCNATGAAKATFQFIPFYKVMQLENKETIEMTISNSQATLGTLSFHAETCFFPNDRILRTIQLPINHSLIDLNNLLKDKSYTREELEFNKIPEKIAAAEISIDKAIQSCYNKLKGYGIRLNEVDEFVKTRIYR